MTKFNPDNKKVLTYKESLEPAMYITDEADAEQYLHDYSFYIKKTHDIRIIEAVKIAMENLKYFAGYYSKDEMERILEVFKFDD